MQITDTAGSHQFPAMQRLSVSKGQFRLLCSDFSYQPQHPLGNAFILVFSISSRQSLEELKPVLELINEVS